MAKMTLFWNRFRQWLASWCAAAWILALCTLTGAVHGQVDPYAADFFVDAEAAAGGDGSSWGEAFNDLQDALTAAGQSISTIWVAEGSYVPSEETNPNDPRSATFSIPTGAILLGGFEGDETLSTQRELPVNPTILSGLITAQSRAYHVVTIRGSGGGGRKLDGFIIENGLADGTTDRDKTGAGVHIEVSGGADIANCTLRFNRAQNAGGGVWGRTSGPLTRFSVINCIFHENTGGGMHADVNSTTTLPARFDCVNNTFWRNTANNGAGLFIDNTDDAFQSEQVILNCTFVENEATGGGAAIAAAGTNTSFAVRNCIVWDNSVNDVISLATQFDPDIPDITVTYSCVVDIPETNGNIADDPFFALQSSNNLRLSACSP